MGLMPRLLAPLLLLPGCLLPPQVDEVAPAKNQPPRIDPNLLSPAPKDGPVFMSTSCPTYHFYATLSDPDIDDILHYRVFLDYNRDPQPMSTTRNARGRLSAPSAVSPASVTRPWAELCMPWTERLMPAAALSWSRAVERTSSLRSVAEATPYETSHTARRGMIETASRTATEVNSMLTVLSPDLPIGRAHIMESEGSRGLSGHPRLHVKKCQEGQEKPPSRWGWHAGPSLFHRFSGSEAK